jgi:adenine phosphoribosyltransferase
VFKDITPLFLDHAALDHAVDELARYAREREAAYVVSAEARGFVLGGAIADRADAGFILARKPGKLPRDTESVEYQLEYGVDALEVHADAVADGSRVLVHDDLLATGGTAGALCGLVEQAGAEVAGCAFVIELAFLDGRSRLRDHDVRSLVVYEED